MNPLCKRGIHSWSNPIHSEEDRTLLYTCKCCGRRRVQVPRKNICIDGITIIKSEHDTDKDLGFPKQFAENVGKFLRINANRDWAIEKIDYVTESEEIPRDIQSEVDRILTERGFGIQDKNGSET